MYQRIVISILCLVISACSTFSGSMPKDDHLPVGDQGGHEKVGNPYKVAGKWYYPKVEPDYDVVGLASWYGKDFHGKKTANGETYNMNALTAAHKTLPMPSYVKVTNLTNGRSIVLRVNDRGPFVGDRIIDVSRRGAQILGFDRAGVIKVRVQASDQNGNVRGGNRPILAENTPIPDSRPTPDRASDGGYSHYVQVGSFSDLNNAKLQADKVRRISDDVEISRHDGYERTFWRVRVGPYSVRQLAESALDRVVSGGFYDARIFSEPVN
ncbi:hypothetical protein GCM10017044_24090 [Kordiimonas sediminis]|uniref:Endolytic peptidoglycan transglycosylase RlpA n=1 Tax=Kordiimonas sediminis TaxID=1735581 RepID=A0A919AXH5_9PROT|nr:septal ring lytic transglycosylase RlpA family protein [Kordiimonas sediminis]GHF28084.1 hypothetical protein GCM10017044_24090 [Kordiimonas sediminis]